MSTKILISIRATALMVGAAAAGVGCYAAYEAAAKADGGYLMVAAPIVALAAAVIPAYFETAARDRQWLRAFILFLVWLPCAATVFYTAIERVHMAKAGGEAQRAALHTVVDRAKQELTEAKAAKSAATAAANKVRGLDVKACKTSCLSVKATETAAIDRAVAAETALAAAEGRAVTEADMKQPEWLQPLALDLAGIVLIGAAFGLGRHPAQAKPAPVKTESVPVKTAAPAAPALQLTPRQIAARKGWETRRRKAAAKTGKFAVVK
jgi:hypothetical protein